LNKPEEVFKEYAKVTEKVHYSWLTHIAIIGGMRDEVEKNRSCRGSRKRSRGR
jgi:hypothetical protein